MKKHPTVNETFYALLFGTIGFAGIFAGIEHYGKNFLAPTVMSVGVLSLVYASSPLWYTRETTNKKKVFESLQMFSFIRSQKKELNREFIFNHRMLLCPIPETTLMEFITIGRRRELKARYGYPRRSLDGENSIRINQAWSLNYFAKVRRQKFIEEVYHSCIRILVIAGFFTEPRQGHPGRLIDPMIGPWSMVEDAKEWWKVLEHQETSSKSLKLRLTSTSMQKQGGN